MNKTTKILIALMLTSQVAMAVQVYSSEKLNDGTYIRKCRYSNGKIDYCTQKDALKAVDVFNNPWKYMTPAQKAQWEKNNKEAKARELKQKNEEAQKDNLEKITVPNSTAISEAIKNIRAESSKLYDKKEAGIDVTKESEVIDYKYRRLYELKDYRSDFNKAYSSLKEGIITQDEYYQIEAKIKEQDAALRKPFDEIMSTTSESLEKAAMEYQEAKQREEKKQRKMEVGRKLLNQGTLYVPPSASNWIRQGADVLELFK